MYLKTKPTGEKGQKQPNERLGDLIDITREEGNDILNIGNKNKPKEKSNKGSREGAEAKINNLKSDLSLPEEKKIEGKKEEPVNINKKEPNFLVGTTRKIKKRWGKNIGKDLLPDFERGLDDMLDIGVISKEEKEIIEKTIKDPEIIRLINTQKLSWTISGFWTLGNLCTSTPATAIAGFFGIGGATARLGLKTFLTLYIIKRIVLSIVIGIRLRKQKKGMHTSMMALVPLVGEAATLMNTYKTNPMFSNNLYAFKMTSGKREKFHNEKDEEKKKIYGEEWKEEFIQEATWLNKPLKEMVKDIIISLPKKIKGLFENIGRDTVEWQIEEENRKNEKENTKK